MNNKLDNYFKKNLENAEWKPSKNVWDKIEQSGAIGERKGFIIPAYGKIAIAAVLTIGLFSAALIWMNQPKESPNFANQEDTLQIIEDTAQSVDPMIEQETVPEIEEQQQQDGANHNESKNVDEIDQSKTKSVAPKRIPKTMDIQRKVNRRKRSMSAEEKIGVEEQRVILAYEDLAPLDTDVRAHKVYRTKTYEATSMALQLAANPPVLEYRSTLDMFEEAGYAIEDDDKSSRLEDKTITEKLFQIAGEKIATFADASGLPFQKLSRADEIEIVY